MLEKFERNVIIESMKKQDIDGVFEVEKNSFDDYWKREDFEREFSNDLAKYLVAKINGLVVGYLGTWFILDECHINSFAVHKSFRGKNISDMLMKDMIDLCKQNRIKSMTLEVRRSNTVAQCLYRKYGFKMAGIRKEYYSNKEDAIIMWNNIEEV